MPTSSFVLMADVVAFALEVNPNRVLDVGPGHGKYGLLCREYLAVDTLAAVEAEPRYLTRFPWLTTIYDTILLGDICEQSDAFLAMFDLVLMLDVIEHLEVEAALALLARIPCPVIVCTPVDFFQNVGWEDYPFETHRSHWTRETLESSGRRIVSDSPLAASVGGILVRLEGQRSEL